MEDHEALALGDLDKGLPMQIRSVTCFIVRERRLLLQERPVGKIWAGMLNGPGGKIDPGETPAAAVVREVLEETGLVVTDPKPRGSLLLYIPSQPLLELSVDIFVATFYEGVAHAKEGVLSWHDRDALPFAQMWADQKYWLPAVLDGFSVEGKAVYETDSLRLARCELQLQREGELPPGD
jgi:8-oxo-dGTP diphosphatase